MPIFQVEDQLFRVPRYMLEFHSPVIADMFSLPPAGEAEGRNDKNPIRLEQVQISDFHRLLELLYPLGQSLQTTTESLTQSWGFSEWLSILRLASKWEMAKIRDYTISRLDTLHCFPSPIEQIQCGEKYGHVPWIRTGYLALIKIDRPSLTEEECMQLGMVNASKCMAAREEAFRSLIDARYSPMQKFAQASIPFLPESQYAKILEKNFAYVDTVTEPVNKVEPVNMKIHVYFSDSDSDSG
ncbi:hypothetical protein K439DRAFT_1397965 [Ramaria rubella]|nr:hypothetical protein K439DRAFT_1397965 [Ramaria rubella]